MILTEQNLKLMGCALILNAVQDKLTAERFFDKHKVFEKKSAKTRKSYHEQDLREANDFLEADNLQLVCEIFQIGLRPSVLNRARTITWNSSLR